MTVRVIHTPHEMQTEALAQREKGIRRFFIPTMGALHDGHLSLIDAARRHPNYRQNSKNADTIVVSIFLNPTQFNDLSDLDNYPKPIERDLRLCEDAGVDLVFLPTAGAMYPHDQTQNAQTTFSDTSVSVHTLTQGLCGASRPGHFTGVTTVVLKLFNIVQPYAAFFGEKDFQQLAVIRQMVRDLNVPIEIVSCPIYREADGLAMSSRNVHLSAEDRKNATILYRLLEHARERLASGLDDLSLITHDLRERLLQVPHVKEDYLAWVDPDTLRPITHYHPHKTLLALAIWIGDKRPIRLIDNARF